MKQSILLFLTYTVTIVAVFYFSGQVTNKTIYDRVIIRLEGPLLPVSNPSASKEFYQRVLEFSALGTDEHEQGELAQPDVMLSLPDKQRIFLTHSAASKASPQVMVIRVRNNLERLHSQITYNFAAYRRRQKLPNGRSELVSDLESKPWGKEFTVSDLDGNEFIFFKPVRKSASRF